MPNVRAGPDASATPAAGRRPGRRLEVRIGTLTVDNGDKVLFFAPVTSGQRARSAADRRLEDQGRGAQSDLPLQPRPVLGRRAGRHQGEDPGRAEQSGRRGLDRPHARSTTASTARRSRRRSARPRSHGCVRLTNWDALTVAALVKPGTPVSSSRERCGARRRRERVRSGQVALAGLGGFAPRRGHRPARSSGSTATQIRRRVRTLPPASGSPLAAASRACTRTCVWRPRPQ